MSEVYVLAELNQDLKYIIFQMYVIDKQRTGSVQVNDFESITFASLTFFDRKD